jgi:hypothetical protein
MAGRGESAAVFLGAPSLLPKAIVVRSGARM